ncbi:MAG: DndE family protein [Desulfosarcina sp.]|nr:DndE family protein [Desulfosarcina sp.]MBC2743812.1 DndE family protein [Desulfosarcina sp.]MBC2766721.1 DndE family protein [Desulfosarcina sp.]
MTKIHPSQEDDKFILKILGKQGLGAEKLPKWTAFRLALAISLHIPTEPGEELDLETKGTELDYEQLTGLGQDKTNTDTSRGQNKDFTDAYRALLSVSHNQDLFQNDEQFRILLQRHIRRGFREMRTSWRESHDFHEYLFQELFSDMSQQGPYNVDLLEDRLQDALMQIGIHAEIRDSMSGPRITRTLVYLKDVHDLDRLRKGLEKISFILGLKKQGVFMFPTDTPKVAALDVPRPSETWQRIMGADLRQWISDPSLDARLPLWPGVDVMGQPYAMDLSLAPHLLVAGTTGSGKSVCLHSFLIALLCQKTDQLQICLLDPKKIEFSYYEKVPHLWGKKVFTEPEEMATALHQLAQEMERRESLLTHAGFRDLSEAEAKGRLNLPRIVVFVEELADLLMQVEAAEKPLVRLAQKARATGIHLILATQRPDAETFSGLLRSNIPSRIAFTVQKSTESKIILDEIGAERLSGSGDMLVKIVGQESIRIHGVYIGSDDISKCVNDARRGR